ncbi:glycosyltransferase family 4 protein [Fictibacillus sp. BK138]|uniref:glycosyltransferase family 4 protein n=1 Tax=Fictibacillus sp. BK138 TaxID=2512121 RepID=UPI0010288162|nr:glycosyltransferase family 4 protein [Fictibacillus sp. BK138]RZT21372.1 glycosyltransferase involved in cell wall biosynthesis [Fictibacillus sp. BK138]
MKLLLITSMYPKQDNLYRNAFVHRRVLNYKVLNPNLEITIFVLNHSNKEQYKFENVNVIEGNSQELQNLIDRNYYNKILIHFIDRHMMKVLRNINFRIPTIIWVHGVEALGWYRRLFNFNLKEFPKYILQNTLQMYLLNRFISSTKNKKVKFVFVSKWMKKILETDTFSKLNNSSIIPNPIDIKLFNYVKKPIEHRKKILLIRPFDSKKYANDIAIKTILMLSRKHFFENLEITIYGKGRHFDKLTSQLSAFENISINNRFLTQEEISDIHKEHGIFLCPTRQDAQGVSMCEAMSSGLIPITSLNTAIPEFVHDGESGFLRNTPEEMAKAIEELYYDPILFQKMSEEASKTIQSLCNNDLTISKEMYLISENI